MRKPEMTSQEAANTLTKFRDEVERAKSDVARSEGELSQVEASLKKQGVKTVEAGEKKLVDLRGKRKKLAESLVDKVEELEENYEFE